MRFVPIEFASWPRRETFWYFSKQAPTGWSMTTRVEITGLREKLRTAGLRFMPVYLWLVTSCLNRQEEFRIAYRDETLGVYDTLTPLYAVFHEDDHTFSLLWTEYRADLREFCRLYEEDLSAYGANHGILARKDALPPPNAYTVSCLPWEPFDHFAVHSYGNGDYFFPSVESGRIVSGNGREYLPLSITCHHATTDGWHVHRFLEDLRAEIAGLTASL